jgi:hypothetical protein
LVSEEAENSEEECEHTDGNENEEEKKRRSMEKKKQMEFDRLRKKRLSIVREETEEEMEN